MAAPDPPTSLRVAGGRAAPRAARVAVMAELEGEIGDHLAADVALIVSELVTNSVRHANTGPDEDVLVELLLTHDRLRIAVIDAGSDDVPHIAERDPAEPGGLGLRLVEQLSTTWGVVRESAGRMRVWCELSLAERATQAGVS